MKQTAAQRLKKLEKAARLLRDARHALYEASRDAGYTAALEIRELREAIGKVISSDDGRTGVDVLVAEAQVRAEREAGK